MKKIIIFGAGFYGKNYYFQIRKEREVYCFAESDAKREGDILYNIPIYDIHKLIYIKDEVQIAVAVSDKYQDEIIDIVKSLGFSDFYCPDIVIRDYEYYKQSLHSDIKQELAEWYELYSEKSIDIEHPKTFNEKVQWLKIYDNLPIKTQLADKYGVRKWISERIGEKYLVPLVGGPWKTVDEINFTFLPDICVLKATHGSNMNYIFNKKGNIDYEELKIKLKCWLNTCFGRFGFESQYYDIPRMIIAESFLQQKDGDLVDYKIYCFNGMPQFIQVIGNRDLNKHTAKLALYSLDWNRLSFTTGDYDEYEYLLEKPKSLSEMIDISKVLSEGFKYVRVDLYDIDGRVYFGEMTFTPGNGMLPWNKEWADEYVGGLLSLS